MKRYYGEENERVSDSDMAAANEAIRKLNAGEIDPDSLMVEAPKMRKPKIELRGIKYSEFASQETYCYQAKIFVDGKHFADVENDGHGGADHVRPVGKFTHDDVIALNELIAATFPRGRYAPDPDGDRDPGPVEMGEEYLGEYTHDLESVCSELMAEYLLTRDAKKLMNKLHFIKLPGQKEIFSIGKSADLKSHGQQLRAQVMRKYPGAIILNDLTIDQVVKILRGEG